jgi:hypothetical protein
MYMMMFFDPACMVLCCSTHFGREREVTCHSEYDSHRAELDTNHWMLSVAVPGSDVRNVPALSEEQ